MNLESVANLVEFSQGGFNQLDRTEAMRHRIIQRVAIEGLLIDKDRPATIEIVEPAAAIDIGSTCGSPNSTAIPSASTSSLASHNAENEQNAGQ